jgi:parallel beta-helix repeat protein
LEVGSTATYHTIQAAVDAANPGDTVEISTGTYQESVVVSTPRLTIEGAPGSNVVIQNPGTASPMGQKSNSPMAKAASLPDGIVVTANPAVPLSETSPPTSILDGFKLSNVTVSGFQFDGVLLIGVKDFTISHVTATNNGEYGIFPIFSTLGGISDSIASGSNDTGIYVGQSSGVNVLNNTAFNNVNGIEIENSVGVVAAGNLVSGNTVGILEDLLPGLAIEVASNNEISSNLVVQNNRRNTASPDDLAGAEPSGVGIAIVGGDHTLVSGNYVTGNITFGIVVLALSDLVHPLPVPYPPHVDPNPNFTLIIDNIVTGNGIDLGWSGKGKHNRWDSNFFVTSNVQLPG